MCDLWPLFCSSDVILYKSMGCINSDLISNLFSKCGQRWNYLTLLLSMIISWNENALFTRISCALDGCLNSSDQWAEIPCQSLWFIHFSRLTCMWHSTKIFFPGFSPHIYLCNHQFSSDNGLVMRRKMYLAWSARRGLVPQWLRVVHSHFGTAPAPDHVRHVNNLWVYILFTGEVNLNTANNSTKTMLVWSNICYLSGFS